MNYTDALNWIPFYKFSRANVTNLSLIEGCNYEDAFNNSIKDDQDNSLVLAGTWD